MTILGPLLMAAVIILPSYLVMRAEMKQKKALIGVIDETRFYDGAFANNEFVSYRYYDNTIEDGKKMVSDATIDYLIYIPSDTSDNTSYDAVIYGRDNINTLTLSQIRQSMTEKIKGDKMQKLGILPEVIKQLNVDVHFTTYLLDEAGQEKRSFAEINKIVGYVMGLLIYMFIALYGSQVMNGALEEKTSRVVEIIVSSVKPFQLMMGKVIGVGLIGLTQFVIWVILTVLFTTVFGGLVMGGTMNTAEMQQMMTVTSDSLSNIGLTNISANPIAQSALSETSAMLSTLNVPFLLMTFLIFFLGGYLLYSSIFAAIGGIVDNETDSQQFTVPIVAILLVPIILLTQVVEDPNGSLAVTLSMIPFTSPIAMMARVGISQGVGYFQLILSIIILFATFVLTTWLAGKIYRTGLLMYGKKVTWKELVKWITFK